ncbi:hypothetical protein MPDQ_001570 [Monascus purpureus]|uniref:RING-type domain-containing protein n=1 Tax=Monascus purpureus TaxID=5098 RepID=A0A507QPU4_MONPU|nr:hypothetical protein MPDQ_001570 [Monascus purpureus]
MVLSLPVPSFSKSSTSPSNQATDGNHHHPLLPASTGRSSEKKQGWKSSATLEASPGNHSTTLAEALRGNPFGATSRSRALEVLARQADEQKREQEELNDALDKLARIFPDVKVEVFRELLVRFDGQSRLHVCVEQLLRHKEEWVAGRWNTPDGKGSNPENVRHDDAGRDTDGNIVPLEERFRTKEYKTSVKTVLSKEFGSLSKSTIDAVLAEVNFSYTRARPTLRDLSRRTWRATLHSILPSFKRKKDRDDHVMLVWQRHADGQMVPRLKETGCEELDRELHEALLTPILQQRKEEQEGRDFELAEELNESEAKAADSLYECECCLGDITFEQMSTCSTSSHIICYNCIRRTLHEALFGQGWNKSVDIERSTLKCIAPLSHGTCDGHLHTEVVKRAIILDKAGWEIYRKFEDRVASETLLKSQMKLIRCPFCAYAEADSVYHPCINCHKPWRDPHICHEPLLLDLRTTVEAARTAAVKRTCPRCGLSFVKSSGCNKLTCVCGYSMCYLCRKALGPRLRGPGRQGRRVPPHENNVNPDGAALGPEMNEDEDEDEEEDEEPEGYKHFCEHFRANPGSRCTECNKCDLYQDVDEEAVARRAGEKAEREWRMRQGMAGIGIGSRHINSDLTASLNSQISVGDAGRGSGRVGGHHQPSWAQELGFQFGSRGRDWRYWLKDVWKDGHWKLEGQALVDSVVEALVIIDEV